LGYEGQIAGLMDDVSRSGDEEPDRRFLKRRSIVEVNARRRDTVAALGAAGNHLRFVNVAGPAVSRARGKTKRRSCSGLRPVSAALFDNYANFMACRAGFAVRLRGFPASMSPFRRRLSSIKVRRSKSVYRLLGYQWVVA